MRSTRRRTLRSAVATVAAWSAVAACGGGTATGAAGLTTPVTGSWQGVSLRSLCDRLSVATGVAIVIDRRIDGEVSLSLDAEDLPARELLRLAASEAGCGLALVRHGARFVPSSLVATIEAGDREAARAEAAATGELRRKLARERAWEWEAGSRPRDLVGRMAESAGIQVDGIDRLPHDHLPAAHHPPLPVGGQLASLLAHYDMTFSPTGPASIRLIPTTEPPVEGTRAGQGDRADDGGTDVRNGFPPRRPPGRPRGVGSRPAAGMPIDAFSLDAAAPLRDLLRALASRFELELILDEASLRSKAVDPREIVRVRLENTPRDGVLDAVLGPLGLEWRIEEGSLRVR